MSEFLGLVVFALLMAGLAVYVGMGISWPFWIWFI